MFVLNADIASAHHQMKQKHMTQAVIRYSPKLADSYPSVKGSLLSGDPEAWNLAWLSHDFSKGPHFNPNFSTLIRRTVQFALKSGGIDLVDMVPTALKVRGLLRLPPAQAVKYIACMEHLTDTPMFAAYGTAWVDLMLERSRLYREPDDHMDALVVDLSQAQAAINASK